MRRTLVCLVALSLSCSSTPRDEAISQPSAIERGGGQKEQGTTGVTITLEDESDAESKEVKRRMEGYLARYDITPYLWKKAFKVTKEPGGFSGATIDAPIEIGNNFGTKFKGPPDELFLTMLHEETHWSPPTDKAAFDDALEHYEKTYPTLAKDAGMEDTPRIAYVHIPVCFYELQAGKRWLGAEKTYEILCETPVYRAIYDRVIADEDAIGKYLTDHELAIEKYAARGTPHECK